MIDFIFFPQYANQYIKLVYFTVYHLVYSISRDLVNKIIKMISSSLSMMIIYIIRTIGNGIIPLGSDTMMNTNQSCAMFQSKLKFVLQHTYYNNQRRQRRFVYYKDYSNEPNEPSTNTPIFDSARYEPNNESKFRILNEPKTSRTK